MRRPPLFLLENVPGLLCIAGQQTRKDTAFQQIRLMYNKFLRFHILSQKYCIGFRSEALQQCGYRVYSRVMDSGAILPQVCWCRAEESFLSFGQQSFTSVHDPRPDSQTTVHRRYSHRHQACHVTPQPHLTRTLTSCSHFDRSIRNFVMPLSSKRTSSSVWTNAVHALQKSSNFLCCRNCTDPPPR